ncbi:MAG: hypothetical protein C4547_01895 [Phycisphaerales bacterium]|nr:MAG: hypothetical protein C4547_01895 [Phycisphaerales bacterium]
MTMSSIIEALQQLQEIERDIAVIRGEEQSRIERIERIERQVAAVDRRLRDAKARISEVQREVDAIDLDVRVREANIAKHREALNTARTNKEYTAILTTLNTEKADSAKIEATELQKMAELDEVRHGLGGIEEERKELLERLDKAKAALETYRQSVAERRARLEQRKAEAAADIPAVSLQTFDRVARHHEGEAMAAVIRIHPRRQDYCCAGCNMKVTLDVVNTLHGGGDLQFCQVCGRILYLDKP